MKKVLIIIPYMGKFPNYFNLWLKSVEYNRNFDWLLITDNNMDDYSIPKNCRIINSTFEELKYRIQSCFDFPIALSTPYKLCDYKPAYGNVFNQEIEGYDFWGFGDLDLIYGDLETFITDKLLEQNDRIFACGHLSLVKNNDFMKTIFKTKIKGCEYYKDVFSSDGSWTFDEFGQDNLGGGYYQICNQCKVKQFNKKLYADIDVKYNKLQCDYGGNKHSLKIEYNKKHVRVLFENGKLFQLWKNKNAEKREVAYIHLQKRKMKNTVLNLDRYYIYPHLFSEKSRTFSFHFDEFGLQSVYIKNIIRSVLNKIRNAK